MAKTEVKTKPKSQKTTTTKKTNSKKTATNKTTVKKATPKRTTTKKTTTKKASSGKQYLDGVKAQSKKQTNTKKSLPKIEHWSEFEIKNLHKPAEPAPIVEEQSSIIIEDSELDLKAQKKAQRKAIETMPAVSKKKTQKARKPRKPIALLALLLPVIAFGILVYNICELDMLPTKYLVMIFAGLAALIVVLVLLLTRRHLAPRIVAYILAPVFAVAAGYGSYYLITTNAAISNFAHNSVLTTDETSTVDISTSPFVILLNGLDSGGVEDLEGRANTDVNQIIAVDPIAHKVLIVNTPRDYYVYLHGVTEMRDKLTHAGYYGLDMSRQTLEDLYNINIDYYVRINFETLTRLVDIIGGIDIKSDYEFKTFNGTYVKKGWNHMNGKEALAFARERKHLGLGDEQRGLDQQIVMMAIFNKITKSSTLLGNFSGILNALSDSFRTDLSIADLKKLVRKQLEDMPSWEIETTAVTGTAIYTKDVYSLDRVNKYYVMIPDDASIEAAREKILTILDKSSD